MDNFGLTEIQARAILDLRLQKLTGLEREKIRAEHEELMKLIAYLKELLENKDLRMGIITEELVEIKDKYGDDRRTEIIYASEDFNPEDFYADDEMVITISHMGYIKRTPLTEFRTQARGGVGARASTTRDEDFIEHMFVATMHNHMLFFTEMGRCFWLKVYQIPEGAKTTKGRAIQNLLNIGQDDKVKAYINVKNLNDDEYINNNYIILATKKGIIKKTLLEAYSRPRVNGVNAITIKDGDQLLNAVLTGGNHEILIASRQGKAIRFHESIVRAIGRTAAGVRGIRLADDNDVVIGMVCVENEQEDILVISENGYGKRSSIDGYRVTNRGGKGVKTLNITDKTGLLIGLLNVTDDDDLMIINRSGITIRLAVSSLRTMGRATQGVRLISLREGDAIASIENVAISGEDDEENSQMPQISS
ncbi:MAG: DNA gyrase subunit A, partial [Bacteroidales bacterium]|nr:DNA gyrase subunit A [Bacteroidales bacterium]